MAHLIDKNLVERANTTMLLGMLWAGWLFAWSGRSPMTFTMGSRGGETRLVGDRRLMQLPLRLGLGASATRRGRVLSRSSCCRPTGAWSETRRANRSVWHLSEFYRSRLRKGPVHLGRGRHFSRARETVARCKPTHPSLSAR